MDEIDPQDNHDCGGLPAIDYDAVKHNNIMDNLAIEFEGIEDIVKYVEFNGGMVLPLSLIDGVKCVAILEIDREERCFELTIRANYRNKHLFSGVARNADGICDVEELHKSIGGMLNGLKRLRYSSVINRFVPTDIKKMSFNLLTGRCDAIKAFTNGMKDADNIKLDLNECCVCLQPTIGMLPCDHNICLQCETKLPKTCCPMCRKKYTRTECDCDGCNNDAIEDVDAEED